MAVDLADEVRGREITLGRRGPPPLRERAGVTMLDGEAAG